MITTRPGNKGPGDLKVYWNDRPILYSELAEIVLTLYQNEDRIYPPAKGFKGGQMLLDFLKEVCEHGGFTQEMIRKYNL